MVNFHVCSKAPEICDEDVGSIVSKRTVEKIVSKLEMPKQEIFNKELKSNNTDEIEYLIREIDRREPLLDYESSKGIFQGLPNLNNILPLVSKT